VPLPERYPRILIQMTNVAYADPADMRAEYDLIMQWLARPEISRDMRQTLMTERDQLAPQLQIDRQRVAAQRHSARLTAALSPEVTDESRALEALARTIQGISAEPGRDDVRYIYHQGERIAISREQAEQLRGNLMTQLQRAAWRGIFGPSCGPSTNCCWGLEGASGDSIGSGHESGRR
jgi:hypothetical protein